MFSKGLKYKNWLSIIIIAADFHSFSYATSIKRQKAEPRNGPSSNCSMSNSHSELRTIVQFNPPSQPSHAIAMPWISKWKLNLIYFSWFLTKNRLYYRRLLDYTQFHRTQVNYLSFTSWRRTHLSMSLSPCTYITHLSCQAILIK